MPICAHSSRERLKEKKKERKQNRTYNVCTSCRLTDFQNALTLNYSAALLLSKFGNLSIRKILVVTSAHAHPYRLWGRGRGVPRQPEGGWRMPSFLGGKSHDHRQFKKRGFLKSSLACLAKPFSSTEVKFRT